MSAEPLDLYGRALTVAREGRGSALWLRCEGGQRLPLELDRWRAPADAADETVLARCRGPVLDVGCGPGRLVAALAARGTAVLGVDIAPAAVDVARATGGCVLRRSVFAALPGEGRWTSVLLIDGNIGIGGSPRRLLARVAALLGPDGRALVEVAPDEVDEQQLVRLESADGRTTAPFPWARVGAGALRHRAAAAGLRPVEDWSAGARRFVALAR